MTSVLNQPFFQDEAAAYAKLESIIWPHGAVCPHCGSLDRLKKMNGAATRPGLFKCYACRKQSRVTVGTVFESSHVQLTSGCRRCFCCAAARRGSAATSLPARSA